MHLVLSITVSLYTCVDPFEVLQHHSNLFLWPRAGVEPAFTRQHREYLRTCAYYVSNLWQFRESVIPHCWITYITHLPKSLGATLPFVHRAIWSGRQDSNLRPPVRSVYKIRTYDTSSIIQTHQFLSDWLTVTKTGVLPTELLPDNCCFP